ncbi:hypothetical protein GGR52DRAFT_567281 [Hypoxylon sp. FL1284]|nr:hypothetical protein GGR52DRAFT_567281 [Hypoxylon sp. FL1284]
MPSRSSVPPPLDLADRNEPGHRRHESFGSYFSEKDKDSRRSTSSSQYEDYRKILGDQHTQTRKSTEAHAKTHSPTVNVYTHCGRHSDQFLFSGWSNVVKSPFRKHH